ncbi:UDP-N-acetylglucosamine 1-carboxyvinyltransferase [Diplocloster agilis]|uniref:UDP-N-acetylglucosamine 1-carboxyvinyltransferase n=1 Tax=Diplocloster agilis TaxID=2850323 RepID=A0A949NDM0_9FIRM|nr:MULTISPECIES: UDP-N-acetylglucosamine 1-carboxyvinyltransferase [Lachnospiraceae]MBU9736126.1 UDP-N-acetylglucosamine 1-carboxyvinyltransferase [Diplocloster agilis]MBU9744966.1 UDP-N-acetylglucosamine 1-carboxyvinyltransferase [Diplocloster agilis]MCU6732141.1 UDP-N-acetylglucosamine 1-carboxyvinyltransferase [Suonthocola fibrivorans]SCI34948.1 UDP-N-acetylglucosamine 1-carboxyvinyltransferase 2 [uncultured Clostridium sp.]
MEQYIIKGGNPLVGEVEIGGAKNAALAILAAAIMTDETVEIDNLPDVKDVNVLLKAIQEIGGKVDRVSRHSVTINGSMIGSVVVENDYIKKIRASYYLLGALLGKYKRAEVALPGGCNIGSRPVDQHLKGFRALGARIDIKHGMIIAEAGSLTGNHIYLDVVTVGATINIMMAAVMASGNTVIENAAKEPHVVDVANFLNSMGANIKGAGTDVIRIKGVEKLHKTSYAIIPDQIEAGTFMFAAAATKGDVMVKNVIPKHLEAITAKLMEIGCEVEEFDDAVRVVSSKGLKHTHVKTLPYPGFPTDMQPQITVTLALSEGTSIVTESIFENRFKYVDELSRMGANIKVEGNTAIIDGTERYTGAGVTAPDLRAGAALVIAGLAAEGITTVDDIFYIERGYEAFEDKLQNLGAMIEKVSTEKDIQKFKLKVG